MVYGPISGSSDQSVIIKKAGISDHSAKTEGAELKGIVGKEPPQIDPDKSLLRKPKLVHQGTRNAVVSRQQFGHEVSAAGISGTGLQGSTAPESTAWFCDGFEGMQELAGFFKMDCGVGDVKLTTDPSVLSSKPKIDDPKLFVIINPNTVTGKDIQQMVDNLRPGDVLVIRQAVSTGSGGRHALNTMITRQAPKSSTDKEGRLTVSIVNTGAGLRFHHSCPVDGKVRYQAARKFVDVDPEKGNSAEFWSIISDAGRSLESVYTIADNHLCQHGMREAVDPDDINLFRELFVSEQQSGICGQQVLFSTLREFILQSVMAAGGTVQDARAKYKRAVLLYKMRSLVLFARQYKTYSRTDAALISSAILALSRRLRSAQADGYLTPEAYTQLSTTLYDIRSHAAAIKEQRAQAEVRGWSDSYGELTPTADEGRLLGSMADAIAEAEGKPVIPAVIPDSWNDVAGTNAREKLETLITLIDDPSIDYGCPSHRQALLTSLARILPVPTEDVNLWSGMRKSDRIAFLEHLSVLHSKIDGKVPPLNRNIYYDRLIAKKAFIALNKLDCLMDNLVRGFPGYKTCVDGKHVLHVDPRSVFDGFKDILTTNEQEALDALSSYYDRHLADMADQFLFVRDVTVEATSENKITPEEQAKLGFKTDSPRDLTAAEVSDIITLGESNASGTKVLADPGFHATIQVRNRSLATVLLVASLRKSGGSLGGSKRYNVENLYSGRALASINNVTTYSIGLRYNFGSMAQTLPAVFSIRSSRQLHIGTATRLHEIKTVQSKEDIHAVVKGVTEIIETPLGADSHLRGEMAQVALENLRKLPPPGDDLWKSLYGVQDLAQLNDNLQVLQQRLTQLLSSLRNNALGDGSLDSLNAALVLSQCHLTMAYFEVLRWNQDLSGARIDIPELHLLPHLQCAWHSPKDGKLYQDLVAYQRGLELNDGSDVYRVPLFPLAKPPNDSPSWPEPTLEGDRLAFECFTALKAMRYQGATGFLAIGLEVPSSEAVGFRKAFIELQNGISNTLQQRTKTRLGERAQSRYLIAPEGQDGRTLLHGFFQRVKKLVQVNETQTMIELGSGTMLPQLAAEAAGGGKALLAAERFFRSFRPLPETLTTADLREISSNLFGDPYLEDQLNSCPEALDRVLEQLQAMRKDLVDRGVNGTALRLLHIEAKLQMYSPKTPQERAAAIRLLRDEALTIIPSYRLYTDLREGPLFAMAIQGLVPLSDWSEEDKVNFQAHYVAYKYLLGEQTERRPSGLDPKLTVLFNCVTQPPDRNVDPVIFGNAVQAALLPLRKMTVTWSWGDDGILLGAVAAPEAHTITFDPETSELMVDGAAPSSQQATLFDQSQALMEQNLGLSVQSFSRTTDGFTAVDANGQRYTMTVDWRENPETQSIDILNYQISTEYTLRSPDDAEVSKTYKLLVGVQGEKTKIIDHLNAHLGIRKDKIGVFVPTDGTSPIFILVNGVRRYQIPKAAGNYDLRNLSRLTEPNLCLAELSQAQAGGGDHAKLKDLLEGLPSDAVIWIDRSTRKLARVEVPSLKLKFDVGDDGRLYVRGQNGFYISSDQNTRMREYIPNAILLCNSKGEEKLLILSPAPSTITSSKLSGTAVKPETALETFLVGSPTSFRVLDIEEEHGIRSLVPQSYSDCLLLCIHFAKRRQYRLLNVYMNRLSMVTAPTAEDRVRLQKLISDLVSQNTTKSRALALALAAKCIRATYTFPGSTPILNSELLKAIKQTLQNYMRFRKPSLELDLCDADKDLLQTFLNVGQPMGQDLTAPRVLAVPKQLLGYGIPTSRAAAGVTVQSKKTDRQTAMNAAIELGRKWIENPNQHSPETQIQQLVGTPSLFWGIALACEADPSLREALRTRIVLCRALDPSVQPRYSEPPNPRLLNSRQIETAAILDNLAYASTTKNKELTNDWNTLFSIHIEFVEKGIQGAKTAFVSTADEIEQVLVDQSEKAEKGEVTAKELRETNQLLKWFNDHREGGPEKEIETWSTQMKKELFSLVKDRQISENDREVIQGMLNRLDGMMWNLSNLAKNAGDKSEVKDPKGPSWSYDWVSVTEGSHEQKTEFVRTVLAYKAYRKKLKQELKTLQAQVTAYQTAAVQRQANTVQAAKTTHVHLCDASNNFAYQAPEARRSPAHHAQGAARKRASKASSSAATRKVHALPNGKVGTASSTSISLITTDSSQPTPLEAVLQLLPDDAQVSDLQAAVKLAGEKAGDLDAEVAILEKKILALAKRLPKGADFESAMVETGAKSKQKLTLTRLLKAWQMGDYEGYRDLVYLSEPDIIELDQMIWDFMLKKTQAQELQRFCKVASARMDSSTDVTPRFVKTLKNDYLAGPHYTPTGDPSHRLFLHMEYQRDIRLRAKQVNFIDKFLKFCDSGLLSPQDATLVIQAATDSSSSATLASADSKVKEMVAQLGTGSGKSKVLAPLMQEVMALLRRRCPDQQSLAGAIWPGKLYLTNVNDASSDLHSLFDRSSEVFQVTRSMDLTDRGQLYVLEAQLEGAISEQRVLHVHPMAVRTLHLKQVLYLREYQQLLAKESSFLTNNQALAYHYKDYTTLQITEAIRELRNRSHTHDISDADKQKLAFLLSLHPIRSRREALEYALPKISRIQSFFRTGQFTNDESHVTQDPVSGNLQFALGKKQQLKPEFRVLISYLFKQLTTNPELIPLLDLANNNQRKRMEAGLNYNEAITPTLIAAAVKKLVKTEHLTEAQRQKLKEFLEDPSKTLPDGLQELGDESKALIYLARGLIHQLIPSTLQKEVDLNFGYTKDEASKAEKTGSITAIPYRAADDPSEGSEFESILVTACASCLTKHFKGLTDGQMREIIESLLERAAVEASVKECSTNETKVWQQLIIPMFGPDITHKDLSALISNNRSPFLYTPGGDLPSSYDPIHHVLIPNNPESKGMRVSYFLQTLGLKELSYYPEKAATSPQTQKHLLGAITHLSATPGRAEMYDQRVISEEDPKSDAEVRALFRKKVAEEGEIRVETEEKPQAIMRNLCAAMLAEDSDVFILVDAGAMIKGVPPLDFALHVRQQLLDRSIPTREDIQAVEFFIGDQMYCITLDDPEPVLSSACAIPNDQRLRYCDHAHLFGADFVLPDAARGIVTLSDTGTEDFKQGGGRLRKLGKEQKMDIVVSAELNARMEKAKGELPIDRLLACCDERQKLLSQQKNFLAVQQQIDLVVRGPIIDHLAPSRTDGKAPSAKTQLAIFEGAKGMLLEEAFPDLAARYGGDMRNPSITEQLEAYADAAKEKLDVLLSAGVISKDEYETAVAQLVFIKKEIPELIKKGVLAAESSQLDVLSLESNVEMEEEQQEEQETDVASATETQQAIQAAEDEPPKAAEYHWEQDLFCDAIFDGQTTDTTDVAVEKKRQVYQQISHRHGRKSKSRVSRAFSRMVGKHKKTYASLAPHRDRNWRSSQKAKIRNGWLKFTGVTLGTLGLYWAYQAIRGEQTEAQIHKLETPGAFTTHSTDSPTVASGTGKIHTQEDLFGALRTATDSADTTTRKAVGTAYTEQVHRFFNPVTTGFSLRSHVSPNVWSTTIGEVSGPYHRAQPYCDRMLVVHDKDEQDQDVVYTVLGSADDLRYWEQAFAEDRRRYSDGEIQRKRHLEIWSTSSGRIERAAQAQAAEDSSEAVQKALEWERIKWNVFGGRLQLSDADLERFMEEFNKLGDAEKDQVKAFIKAIIDVKDHVVSMASKGTEIKRCNLVKQLGIDLS